MERAEPKRPGPTERTERPPETREPRPMNRAPPDTVFIGKKPLMAYATAVMMHFNMGSKELNVKARGGDRSHAVGVVEVVRRRFFEGKLSDKEGKIGSRVGRGRVSEEPVHCYMYAV